MSFVGTYAFLVLLYSAASEILTNVLPMPKEILKIEDKKERSKKFCEYIASFPALVFDVFIVVLGFCVTIYYGGVHFGLENSPFMQVLLMVI